MRSLTLPCLIMLTTGCAGGSQAPSSPEDSAARAGVCAAPEAMIEDAEDGNDQILQSQGRGGYLYTYVDDGGSTIEPDPGGFWLAEGGMGQSQYAMHMEGQTGTGSEVYTGMGFSFAHPKAPYDASAYTGLAFYAKKGPDSDGRLRLKLPDVNTDPEGERCTECFNDFGVDLDLTEEWTLYTVSFTDLAQGAGWGNPQPGQVDASALYGIQFQFGKPGARYDVWIDDIAFTCD